MGQIPITIFPRNGKPINDIADVPGIIRQMGSDIGASYYPGSWICVWATDTMAAEDEEVLLLPRAPQLMTPDVLTTIWYIVEASKANLSFDPNIGFLYGRVTIVGDSIKDGISDNIERELKEDRKVERIPGSTAENLLLNLKERLKDIRKF